MIVVFVVWEPLVCASAVRRLIVCDCYSILVRREYMSDRVEFRGYENVENRQMDVLK